MATTIQHLPILNLFKKFISDSQKGRRLKKNGALISKGTIDNYKSVLSNLIRFEEYSKKQWTFNIYYRPSKSNFEKEKHHYKNFYQQFTNFLYTNGCYDTYVGFNMKIIRTFFIYMVDSKGYQMGLFYKHFYTIKEEIPVIVINQEQLKFLIHNKEFENRLPAHLKQSKDIFVVGCSIGLRFSDLMALRKINLEKTKDSVYIVTKSIKTNTYTRIKIPEYVLKILKHYCRFQKTLLPRISLSNFNKHLKTLGKMAGWTQETGKVRSKRGIKKEQKSASGKLYRFCDLLSSHVMRKTTITTMLILGMPETLVRKVSGHAANSKEFYKYVNYSDSFMDKETDRVFAKLVE
jgi:integrase